jgi:multidrug transporter EmrE-like cation transporter
MVKLKSILLVILCTIITSVAQLLWKFGAMRLPEIITNIPVIAGFAAYVIAAFLLITSFKGGEVSVLYPMYATDFIWVSILSALYLAEPLNGFKFAGIAAIIIGVVMLGRGAHSHKGVITP